MVVGQVGKLGKNGCGSRDRESIQKNGDQLGWGRGGGAGRLIIGPASGKKVWRVRLQQVFFQGLSCAVPTEIDLWMHASPVGADIL